MMTEPMIFPSASIPLLDVNHLSKTFGGLQALSDVSLHVQTGSIHGLIGPNGAGKTTLFNMVTGVLQACQGTILLHGKPIVNQPPERIAQLGIRRTFQNIRLFKSLSVLDHVLIGQHRLRSTHLLDTIFLTPKHRREEQRLRENAIYWLTFVGLEQKIYHCAAELSYGDQRRLEIARALVAEPKLLALDEPAAGMNATEKETLKTLFQKIQRIGITILLIEHDVKLVMGLCHHMTVLDYGKVIADGPPEHVRNHPDVISAYLGRSHA